MTTFDKQVTDEELAAYADLIYRVAGVRISPQKKALLSNRVRRRLRETGLDCFTAYLRHLSGLKPSHPEWDAFLQEITTHETYLFRDAGHWQWFEQDFLAGMNQAARAGQRPRSLRIWSAACSTGDEAYTMALGVTRGLPNWNAWQIKILGTDIGVGAVEQANGGLFSQRAVRLVDAQLRQRYFVPQGERWQAKPELKALVEFRQHNLLDRLAGPPFDLVVLKNVLIYFDRDSKRKVLDQIARVIRPGGLLLTGPAEGVADMLGDYQRVETWLHRRR